jgi:hypothetical protein
MIPNSNHPQCQPTQVPVETHPERNEPRPFGHPTNERREFPVEFSFGGGISERLKLAEQPTPTKDVQS